MKEILIIFFVFSVATIYGQVDTSKVNPQLRSLEKMLIDVNKKIEITETRITELKATAYDLWVERNNLMLNKQRLQKQVETKSSNQ